VPHKNDVGGRLNDAAAAAPVPLQLHAKVGVGQRLDEPGQQLATTTCPSISIILGQLAELLQDFLPDTVRDLDGAAELCAILLLWNNARGQVVDEVPKPWPVIIGLHEDILVNESMPPPISDLIRI